MNRELKADLRGRPGPGPVVAVPIPMNRELKVGSDLGSPRHYNGCIVHPMNRELKVGDIPIDAPAQVGLYSAYPDE